MKQLSSTLQAHLAQELTSLATVWTIQRRDGAIFQFTDADMDFSFGAPDSKGPQNFGGDLRLLIGPAVASAGFMKSNLADKISMDQASNIQIDGIIDSVFITDRDLRLRRWDYANVIITMTNWVYAGFGVAPDPGDIRLFTGQFGPVTLKEYGWNVEMRGLTEYLATEAGDIYQPSCRVDLGSTKCGVNLPALTQYGTVVSTDGIRNMNIDGINGDPGYFDGGLVTWFSGQNQGASAEVKQWNGVASTPIETDPTLVGSGANSGSGAAWSNPENVSETEGEPPTINHTYYRPTTYSATNGGAANPTQAFDNNTTTYAEQSVNGGDARGETWAGFSSATIGATTYLRVISQCSATGTGAISLRYSRNGGQTWYDMYIISGSGNRTRDYTVDSVLLPSGTSRSQVQVRGEVHPGTDSGYADQKIYEIFIDVETAVGGSPPGYADVIVGAGSGNTNSQKLLCQDFGFNIVGYATRVVLTFKYYWTGGGNGTGSSPFTSCSVQLLKAAVGYGISQDFELRPGYSGNGTANNPLSYTLTFFATGLAAADINASGFGVQFFFSNVAVTTDFFVDSVMLKVTAVDALGGNLTLFSRSTYAIQAGDTFALAPGCDKLISTCKNKFHNVLNFRGEPTVPNPDHMLDFPDYKAPYNG